MNLKNEMATSKEKEALILVREWFEKHTKLNVNTLIHILKSQIPHLQKRNNDRDTIDHLGKFSN